ncbi:MAG: DUF1572 family protein [Saprospiraceae bacterium]
MSTSYLSAAKAQFNYYKSLGDKTISRLNEEQLHWQPGPESNSIATIVKHMVGNMHSRWTDFLNTDGEKDFRNREDEFTAEVISKNLVIEQWNTGWQVLFSALDEVESLGPEGLEQTIYIRNMGHTVTEAINRQLCHYSYHVGQMTFVGRMMLADKWESLSIPKGESVRYNEKTFAKGKRKEHFTEEWLEEKKDD